MMALHDIETSQSFIGHGVVSVSCGCGWTAEAENRYRAAETIEQHRRDVRRENAEARLRDTVDDPAGDV